MFGRYMDNDHGSVQPELSRGTKFANYTTPPVPAGCRPYGPCDRRGRSLDHKERGDSCVHSGPLAGSLKLYAELRPKMGGPDLSGPDRCAKQHGLWLFADQSTVHLRRDNPERQIDVAAARGFCLGYQQDRQVGPEIEL